MHLFQAVCAHFHISTETTPYSMEQRRSLAGIYSSTVALSSDSILECPFFTVAVGPTPATEHGGDREDHSNSNQPREEGKGKGRRRREGSLRQQIPGSAAYDTQETTAGEDHTQAVRYK